MAIEITIKAITPLDTVDAEILNGLSVMIMAIANHAAQGDQPPAMPCMAAGKDGDAGKVCVNEVGHKGRHKFRVILPPSAGVN